MKTLAQRLTEIGERDGEDRDTINGTILTVEYDELEKNVEEYLAQNPDATLQDILQFLLGDLPPLEIVDDEEADDGEGCTLSWPTGC